MQQCKRRNALVLCTTGAQRAPAVRAARKALLLCKINLEDLATSGKYVDDTSAESDVNTSVESNTEEVAISALLDTSHQSQDCIIPTCTTPTIQSKTKQKYTRKRKAGKLQCSYPERTKRGENKIIKSGVNEHTYNHNDKYSTGNLDQGSNMKISTSINGDDNRDVAEKGTFNGVENKFMELKARYDNLFKKYSELSEKYAVLQKRNLL